MRVIDNQQQWPVIAQVGNNPIQPMQRREIRTTPAPCGGGAERCAGGVRTLKQPFAIRRLRSPQHGIEQLPDHPVREIPLELTARRP